MMHAFAASNVSGSGKKKNYTYPQLAAYGVEIKGEDQHAMVQRAVDAVAEEITAFVAATWKDGIARFSPIRMIGGGTFYFFEAVKRRIPHLKKHIDPVYANALGYQTLAARKLPAFLQELKQQQAQQALKQQEVVKNETAAAVMED